MSPVSASFGHCAFSTIFEDDVSYGGQELVVNHSPELSELLRHGLRVVVMFRPNIYECFYAYGIKTAYEWVNTEQ